MSEERFAERMQMLYNSYISEQQRAIHDASLKREVHPPTQSHPELF